MRKLFAIAMAVVFGLFLFSLTVHAQSEQASAASQPPPVSQPLVPEGDFALKLAAVLKLGTPTTEAQAEDLLTSVGITPKNGWIADYPMTPIITGQLQSAVLSAATEKKITMGNNEALQAFRGLTTEFGLAVAPATGNYASNEPPQSGEYVQPSEVDNYYDQEGPPVVTYYPPPPDYGYLYAWVPYPFFCSAFFFPGFFVLNDFDIIVVHDHFRHDHDFHHRITNHFVNPRTHEFVRVDPTARTMGRSVVNASMSGARGFTSPEGRRGAVSIMNRGQDRFAALNTTRGTRSEGIAQGSRSFNSPSSHSLGASHMAGRSSFGTFHSGGFGGFHGGGFSGGFHGGGMRR